MLKGSWKTTLAGVGAVLSVIVHVINCLTAGTPIDFTVVITGITTGIGLIFARDNNKTSEQVGAAKTPQGTLPLTVLLLGALLLTSPACNSTRLEKGGAYAPIAAEGQTQIKADIAFFRVETAFDFAYSAIDAAFKFEADNEKLLWQISPNIKHSLDKIRPEAVKARNAYAVARTAYLANPTPAGLSKLEEALQQTRQLSDTAAAIVNEVQKYIK